VPTTDPQRRLRPEQVAPIIAGAAFPEAGLANQRGIGVEVEFFGLHPTVPGWRRLTLAEQAARLDHEAHGSSVIGTRADVDAYEPWPAATGRLTFEPGGQIEFSGGVQATAADALDEVEHVTRELVRVWGRTDDRLVSVGTDVFSDNDEVEQQLPLVRYRAMDRHLAARGSAGRRMMRNTCSVQVNLDPGVGEQADARWRLANLAAPVITASFACSPALPPDPAVSTRARAWRQLDQSRTGIPSGARLGRPIDRVEQWTQFSVQADVLLLHDPDAADQAIGFTFGQWLSDGHASLGWPTGDDLLVHLSTLFPEVRPRGSLEIRSIDGLPGFLRCVPTVLLTGLLYDDRAAEESLRILAPMAPSIRDTLARSGEVGLKNAELCAVAVELWSLALAGARRLGAEFHRPADLRTAEQFIDQYTMRGRCPADELRERLADDPDDALNWAAERLPDVALDRR
jgi:glutamate--cysteine ligase